MKQTLNERVGFERELQTAFVHLCLARLHRNRAIRQRNCQSTRLNEK